MLYKTGVEYGDYTMNYTQGCSHGCKYPCYAYLMAKRFGRVRSYEEWCEPLLVENTLELLDKEIPRLKSKIKTVQPYPTPNLVKQELGKVLEAVGFVDRIVFGRANYNREVSSYPSVKEWYNGCVEEVLDFCKSHGIDAHIKKGTWTGTPSCVV